MVYPIAKNGNQSPLAFTYCFGDRFTVYWEYNSRPHHFYHGAFWWIAEVLPRISIEQSHCKAEGNGERNCHSESADIILLEKNLLILESGVTERRKTFANIIKYIRMGTSSNFGNMFSVLGASALLPFLPMQPVQILINNLLYDFSQTGIPFDDVDREQLVKPPKWKIDNIQRFMIFIGPISSIFDYANYSLPIERLDVAAQSAATLILGF